MSSTVRAWPLLSLEQFAETCSGSTPNRGNRAYFGGAIPWVKTAELHDGTIAETEEHVTPLALEECSLRLLPAGTVLVAMYGQGQTRGRTGLLARPATTNQACFAILPNPGRFEPRYLQYWFRSQYLALRRSTESRGGNQPNLSGALLKSVVIPLPPVVEQQRLVLEVDSRFDAVGRARAAAEAQLEAASALAAARRRVRFGSIAGPRWRLGDLLRLRKDVVHPRDNPSGTATFVGLEHVETGTGRRLASVGIDQAKLTGRKPRFRKGDIVYGYLRPYLNKVWIAEFDGLCSVDQYVYEVDPSAADPGFIAAFMRSPVFLERAPISTSPGQLPRIRTEEVAAVELNLPSLPEQRALASSAVAEDFCTLRIRKGVAEQLSALDLLPAALLRRAFAGAPE